ncbi:MAG TPA: hypothetical protein PLU17_03860, partial [Chitinophagaceae bacterium]|nr:hypothetical protein [Chitinophagaceae bacterium]
LSFQAFISLRFTALHSGLYILSGSLSALYSLLIFPNKRSVLIPTKNLPTKQAQNKLKSRIKIDQKIYIHLNP